MIIETAIPTGTATNTVFSADRDIPDDDIVTQMFGYDPKSITLSAKQSRLKALGNITRLLVRTSIINAYLIGKNLLEARALSLDEENKEIGYVEWLRENAGMGLTNSYAYRNLALNYCFYFEPYLSDSEKRSTLEKININTNVTAFLCLAAPGVPDSARKESIAMLEAGENFSPESAKNLIEKYKHCTDRISRVAEEGRELGEFRELEPASLLPEAWSKSEVFTITLDNNSCVSVKFESQFFDEEIKCHYFEFRGDVAENGVRSHYAPYSEANNYATPKEYAQGFCEKLHDQLQAKRSRTPYHDFKKGDRVEVIKGKSKGIKTEITELLTGKNRCIITSDGEFSPAQLRKIEQSNALENSSTPKTEEDKSSEQAQVACGSLALSASLQDETATEKPDLGEGLSNHQPLYLSECNSPDEVMKFIKYSNPVKIWQEVKELQTTTNSLIAQKAQLEQKIIEMQTQLGQFKAS